MAPTNIYFVGLMGSGKSTVGRVVASRLSRPFYDSDHEIEAYAGRKIKTIFETDGEAYFRQLEREAITRLTSKSKIVLATGGGAILNAENRRLLKETGIVVYLRATPNDLAVRMRKDNTRPLLQGVDVRKKLNDLYNERDPLYREVASYVIDTGRPSVGHLVGLVLMQIELSGTAS